MLALLPLHLRLSCLMFEAYLKSSYIAQSMVGPSHARIFDPAIGSSHGITCHMIDAHVLSSA